MTADIRLPITSCGKTKAPWMSMATQWWVHQHCLAVVAPLRKLLCALTASEEEGVLPVSGAAHRMLEHKHFIADAPYFQEGATTFDFVVSSVVVLDGRYSGLASGYSEIQSVSRSFLNTEKYRAKIQGSLHGCSLWTN